MFFLIKMVPMLSVMGAIFFLSHQSGDELAGPNLFFLDKIAHFSIYMILAGTVIFALSGSLKKNRPSAAILMTISICFIYGISDEFHQSFIDDRFASVNDVIADLCGSLMASYIWARNSVQCQKYFQ